MDVSQYLEIFIDETKEHLQNLNEQLLILEKEPENQDTINEIFRAAHTIKGMAGTMGYKRMQKLTHDMENVFSEIRNGKMKASSQLVDILFKGLDALQGYLDNIVNSADEGTDDNQDIIDGLAKILDEGLNAGKGAGDKKAVEPAKEEATKAKDGSSSTKITSLATFEINAANKAISEGSRVLQITVYVNESCVLKAARAFLVFKTLEDAGDVIKSNPSTQDIEDEKFEFEFSLLLITKFDNDKVQKLITNVSEIKSCSVEEFKIPSMDQATDADNNVQQAAGAGATAGTAAVAVSQTIEAQAKTVTDKALGSQSKNENESSAASKAVDGKTVKTAKPVVNRSVRVDIDKLDDLMNLVSELIIAKNGLVSINNNSSASNDNGNFNEQIEYLERITTSLHKSVMKTRMVPIESVVSRFPRMIRDLSKSLNKKMELYITGEDTELDRTVIDEIGDPIMHLLRNAADHGLEQNEERVRLGKPEVGSIKLDAYQEGNNVVISVTDDGSGINVEKVKAKAIQKGTITEEQAASMSDKEVIDLLFQPSFSTAEKVTEVSGRGVGLDVVKTKIQSLGGNVETKTALGKGSSFIIRLPLTLAIIQALMVELGNEKYAIPLGSIETIEDVPVDKIKYVQTKEVINLRGNVIPLIRLDKVLDVEHTEDPNRNLTVVIVKKGDKLAGLIVDNLMGQLEIVIKSIGKYINNSKMISGATILGDGEIALILDVNMLV